MGNQNHTKETKEFNNIHQQEYIQTQNNRDQNKKPKIENFLWQEATQINEAAIWDPFICQFFKFKIKINFTKDKEIIYSSMDGSILRIDQISDTYKKPDVHINLDQIQNLHWQGRYGGNNKKIGQWSVVWNGEILKDVGGSYGQIKFNNLYQNDGLKQGLWKILTNNYWKKAKLYEIGEYFNDYKRGKWMYIYEEKEIGGGSYDKFGEKTGEWIEISTNFWDESQIINIGNYKNGNKVGRWNINWREQNYLQFQKIGGGSYENKQQGDEETKIGEWIELSGGFQNKSQVTYSGKYLDGKKIDRWNIFLKDKLIGGGQYGFQQNNYGIKLGKWIELDNGFYNSKQVTYKGEYKNGIKVGKWDTYFTDSYYNQEAQIGGGFYDEQSSEEQGIKTGRWIEISDGFYEYNVGIDFLLFTRFSQMTYAGEYQNGNKIGRWDIYFKNLSMDNNIYIGGGLFEIQLTGNSIKRGKWMEPNDRFRSESQVIYFGEYKNGEKIGFWQIYYKNSFEQQRKQIGGGMYNDQQECQGIKIGKWIELSNEFWRLGQVTYQGVYRNGKKVSKWTCNTIDDLNVYNYLIGGGSYDGQQNDIVKKGNWIEQCDQFWTHRQILYQGKYANGKKIGRWVTFWRWRNKLKQIGGGQYDNVEGEGGVQTGEWTVMDDKFISDFQVTHKGKYQNGKKVGKWDTYYREGKQLVQVGGGSYDQKLGGNEIKIGKWIVLSDSFKTYSQVIYCGEYKCSKKIGRWDICWRQTRDQLFQQIGGGSYDGNQQREVDVKIGKWIESIEDLKNNTFIFYNGEYRNGQKIGKWDMFKRKFGETEVTKMYVILLKYICRCVETYDN